LPIIVNVVSRPPLENVDRSTPFIPQSFLSLPDLIGQSILLDRLVKLDDDINAFPLNQDDVAFGKIVFS
jgi:hypothetical protein